jgi:hypothetical protein
MSEDMDGEDMELLARFGRRPSGATLNGRRARETRPLARADRQRVLTPSIKSRQLNVKVTPEFYERAYAIGRNLGMSMSTLIESALEDYARQQGVT